jgi:hypothetical protein
MGSTDDAEGTLSVVLAPLPPQSVPVTVGLAVPPSIVFARVFAAVFEIPSLEKQETKSQTPSVPPPRADGVAG